MHPLPGGVGGGFLYLLTAAFIGHGGHREPPRISIALSTPPGSARIATVIDFSFAP